MTPIRIVAILLLLALAPAPSAAEDRTHAGEFVVEHPTLHHLGLEWCLQGADNRNAPVAVQFRPAGTADWRTALPLVRIGGERVFREREHLDYVVPHGFAGSIFGLAPATDYECRVTLA